MSQLLRRSNPRWLFFFPLLLCLRAPDLCAATTLNMSHDLVALGIAAHDMAPNVPTQDARPLFTASIQYARTHGVARITVDTGTYYFLTSESDFYYLYLGSLSNLTIDLSGSTLYFKDAPLYGIGIGDSSGITLKNFETDYINAPYTHVQLTSMDANLRVLYYQTLGGWQDPVAFNTFNPLFGTPQLFAVPFRNGAPIPGTTRMAIAGPISGGALSLVQNNTPWTQPDALAATFQPGDVLVVIARGGGSPIQVYRSDNVTVSDVNVHGSSSVAVIMDTDSNSTVERVKVTPRPNGGLIAANADGIMFNLSQRNNVVRNSYVTRTLDDGISMNGLNPAKVISQSGPRTVTVMRSFYNRFPNGTLMNFVDPVTGSEIPGAIIVSQVPPDSSNVQFGGQVELTFDQDLPTLPANAGVAFGSPTMRGAGSVVEDNVIDDLPFGRGIWIGGCVNLIVRRNLVQRTSNAGIMISNDTQAFPGPPNHDVTIRDNRLLKTVDRPGARTPVASAAILVTTLIGNQNDFGEAPANTNISIVNNFIADAGRSGIWVGEASGGTIQNNYISRWYTHPEIPLWRLSSQYQQQVLADFSSAIVVRYSSGVLNQSNQTNAGQTPAVSLSSVTPTGLTAGAATSAITLNGTFLVGSFALLGTTPLPTDFVSANQLTATIPSSELATARVGTLTVANPDPGGASSGSALFRIYAQRRSQLTSQ